MSKTSFKGSAMLAPVPPALISCGDMTNSNIITVAWTGMLATNPPTTYISLRKERYSYDIIKNSGEFVINLCTAKLVPCADFCGVRSGKDIDKFEFCNLSKEKAFKVSCPLIAESPISLECKVKEIVPLGSHDMFIAEIVSCDISEKIIDKKNKIHFESADLAAFAHGEYFSLGKRIGTFGYTVKKDKK